MTTTARGRIPRIICAACISSALLISAGAATAIAATQSSMPVQQIPRDDSGGNDSGSGSSGTSTDSRGSDTDSDTGAQSGNGSDTGNQTGLGGAIASIGLATTATHNVNVANPKISPCELEHDPSHLCINPQTGLPSLRHPTLKQCAAVPRLRGCPKSPMPVKAVQPQQTPNLRVSPNEGRRHRHQGPNNGGLLCAVASQLKGCPKAPSPEKPKPRCPNGVVACVGTIANDLGKEIRKHLPTPTPTQPPTPPPPGTIEINPYKHLFKSDSAQSQGGDGNASGSQSQSDQSQGGDGNASGSQSQSDQSQGGDQGDSSQ